MILREEMIDCESWYHLADYHYTGENDDLPVGIIHCDLGNIPNCFVDIAKHPERKYVVISSRSDFGLHYQANYPPWQDYGKMALCAVGPDESKGGYADVLLPAPINKDRCAPWHTYSIKCYRYTEATFPSIPGNVVKWFVTNNAVSDDSRIVSIPFGINGVDGSREAGDKIVDRINKMNWYGDRGEELYINFAFYTDVRYRLYQLYAKDSFAKCEQNKPYDEFLDQLMIHNCVLCPPGNGWDCYRNLEAIYMGCIPIVENNTAMRVYADMKMPCVFVSSLEMISSAVLKEIRASWLNHRDLWDLTKAKLSYWKGLIEQGRNLLL